MQQVHLVGREPHQHLGANILPGIFLLIELGVELLVARGGKDLRGAAAAHLERARDSPCRMRNIARDIIPEDAFVYCGVDLVDDVLELGRGPGAQADLLDLHAKYVPTHSIDSPKIDDRSAAVLRGFRRGRWKIPLKSIV